MVTFRSNNNNNRRPPFRSNNNRRPPLEAIMKGQNFLIMIIFKEKYQAEIIIMPLN